MFWNASKSGYEVRAPDIDLGLDSSGLVFGFGGWFWNVIRKLDEAESPKVRPRLSRMGGTNEVQTMV
jgi:hypothetical protein